MKKIIAIIFAALLLLTFAAHAEPAFRIEYEGYGYVEVEFGQDVLWQDPQVSVSDEAGTAYDVQIIRADEDDLKFRIPMIEDDRTYAIAISGMAESDAISCTLFADPEKSSMIEEAEFDGVDNKLELDFNFDVVYDSSFTVTITDMNGNEYSPWRVNKDSSSLDIYIDSLTPMKSHIVSITGIAAKDPKAPAGLGNFSAVYSIKFVAALPCCA